MSAPKNFRCPTSPTYNKVYKVYQFIGALHGSGIDADWSHVMDDYGYYDGWADFTIIFSNKEPMGKFKLEFNGQDSQRLNRKYMLREYLEDTIANILDELNLR